MTSPLLEPDVPEIATATEVPSLNPVSMGSVKGDPDGDVKMADAGEDLKARVTIKEDTKEPGEEQQPPAKAVNGMHDAHTLDNADRVWPIEEPPPPPMSPVVKEATSDFVVPIPNGHSTYSSTRRSPTPDRFFYGRRKTSEPTWDDRRHRSPSPDYSRRRRSPSFERRRRSPSEEYEDRRGDYRRADSVQTKVELIDIDHDGSLPFTCVGFDLFLLWDEIGIIGRGVKEDGRRGGVSSYIPYHEADIAVVVGSVTADGVVGEGGARGLAKIMFLVVDFYVLLTEEG